MVVLTGCVVLPVPSFSNKVVSGKRIQSEDISFVQPGVTTVAAFVERLGEPWARYQDLGVMVYCWETLAGHWVAVMPPSGFNNPWASEEITRLHYLLVQIDERDRVQRCGFIKSPGDAATKDVVIKWLEKKVQPDGPANGSQPVGSETNQTSTAAASRRSP